MNHIARTLLLLAFAGSPALTAPEMMRSSDAHRRLDFMVGDWEVDSRAHMGERVHALAHRTSIGWLPGGVWLEQRTDEFGTPIGKMFGGARIAWDARSGEYVRYWIDNQSVVVLPQRGRFVDEHTLEFRGSFEWVDGTVYHQRLVIRNDPQGGFTETESMGLAPDALRLNHEATYRPVTAAARPMPAWLRDSMEFLTRDGGRFVTDNAAYRSEGEPWDAYGLEWRWGLGRQSVTGRLFGLADGEEKATFWEFRTIWHPGKAEAQAWQYGGNGVVGSGTLEPDGKGKTRMDQTFFGPDGSSFRVGHVSTDTPEGTHVTESFDIQPDGTWRPRRTYVWKRETPQLPPDPEAP